MQKEGGKPKTEAEVKLPDADMISEAERAITQAVCREGTALCFNRDPVTGQMVETLRL